MERRTTLLELEDIIWYGLGALKTTFITDESGMTPAIPGRTSWQVGSAMTLEGKLGLLSEQTR